MFFHWQFFRESFGTIENIQKQWRHSTATRQKRTSNDCRHYVCRHYGTFSLSLSCLLLRVEHWTHRKNVHSKHNWMFQVNVVMTKQRPTTDDRFKMLDVVDAVVSAVIAFCPYVECRQHDEIMSTGSKMNAKVSTRILEATFETCAKRNEEKVLQKSKIFRKAKIATWLFVVAWSFTESLKRWNQSKPMAWSSSSPLLPSIWFAKTVLQKRQKFFFCFAFFDRFQLFLLILRSFVLRVHFFPLLSSVNVWVWLSAANDFQRYFIFQLFVRFLFLPQSFFCACCSFTCLVHTHSTVSDFSLLFVVRVVLFGSFFASTDRKCRPSTKSSVDCFSRLLCMPSSIVVRTWRPRAYG